MGWTFWQGPRLDLGWWWRVGRGRDWCIRYSSSCNNSYNSSSCNNSHNSSPCSNSRDSIYGKAIVVVVFIVVHAIIFEAIVVTVFIVVHAVIVAIVFIHGNVIVV